MNKRTDGGDHGFARALGAVSGLALAGVLTKLSVTALEPTNSGYAGIGIMFAALGFGVPLFLLTLCITIYLACKGALHGRWVALMWLPFLVSLAILPVAEFFGAREREAYAGKHPDVREVHVNLTGRDLRLDPAIGPQPEMEGAYPDRFLELRREPVAHRDDHMAAYRGVLPAAELNSMTVIYGPKDQGEAVSVPVAIAPTPADLAPFLPEPGSAMAKLLVHYYYHYPDRVDVASTIDWDLGNNPQYDNGKPASGVVIHNLSNETIVRLEVNGQLVPFYHGLQPLRADYCTVNSYSAVLQPGAKLRVRWQGAQSAPKWNDASPAVPTFRKPVAGGGSVTSSAVHLFFYPDGRLRVQRSRSFTTASGGGVGVSVALPAFDSMPVCGDAAEQYPPTLARNAD
ncbi:hypothetical protein SAMN05428959_10195 [Duganella sp. CF517]|uniref:hypothetical protein n=1 Tax=Duganella sp. CF517 TaxID=1881038 RepID=UPI0008B66A31|nr:hypothetical protein [Duganella sp. CF517]SEN07992.1 hypothetical protein SAMN05428959_10195 [Duganella sp. CF517]